MSEDAFADVLQRITEDACRSNQDRLARLEVAVGRLAEGTLDAEGRHEAATVAHQLVGSAGTFGHPRVSALARELHTMLDPAATAAAEVSEEGPAELAGAALALVRRIRDTWHD